MSISGSMLSIVSPWLARAEPVSNRSIGPLGPRRKTVSGPELDVGDEAVVDERAVAAHGSEHPAAFDEGDASVDARDVGVGDDDVVALFAADRDFTLIGESPGSESAWPWAESRSSNETPPAEASLS